MTSAIENPLDQAARDVLLGNDRGGYTIPTARLYPYQWNWDSMFSAWGYGTFDMVRAWQEVDLLFASQWDTGMVPHIIFHNPDPDYFPGPGVWGATHTPPTSGISQPPVAATLILKLYEMDPEAGLPHLKTLYPKLVAWHDWWIRERCKDGPVAIIHPWESGRDNCPDWDIGMEGVQINEDDPYTRRDTGHVNADERPLKWDYDRYLAILAFGRSVNWDDRAMYENGPFLMADPGISFVLLRAFMDLIEIGRILGEDTAELSAQQGQLRDGISKLWNVEKGWFDAYDLRTGDYANVLGSGAFLAYFAGVSRPALDAHFARIWDKVSFGVPSADPESERFDPRRYWRGPTWPVVNSLIAMGLTDMGRNEAETRLRNETAALIEAGGFWEYYDPLDGTPCGGASFGWTAAIWLTWCGKGRTAAQTAGKETE
ncbi:MGH1-like glycoside hydrolase domain-containing protein [Celeribacter baekdonensis]|uniref:Mannosylglycerate hydrolase MGH1-like glycoside hydrolase domain-containing protein n=1 Tax=Celeribacter baekdonensis TaxID=875171 RepID=A0A2R4M750_9RHOB|nr:hypothetical protein [Celeribacter baekdonensis]AVW92948.1 hypothetical protein DA792_19170 [Celeribacter baekdonensis]